MHPTDFARICPDKPAIIMAASGQTISYRELDENSNRAAHLFRALGLERGSVVALLLDNNPYYLQLAWAAQRSGLYYVCLSSRLTTPEISHILADSGAALLITCESLEKLAVEVATEIPNIQLLMTGTGQFGIPDLRKLLPDHSASPVADESAGADMLYSSGTTGRPKGIRRPLAEGADIRAPVSLTRPGDLLGFNPDVIYLSPAPLYHAAPLRWSMLTHRNGGSVVVMEKFDAEEALALIDRYRVTHSQWVPTHFVRMLKLPDDRRRRYDLSSLQLAIHAAAPCPIPVKEAMIDWWGSILLEYYAGTESNGMTMIASEEWMSHRGSVGRAVVGTLHICDDAGAELAAGIDGTVFFEGGADFAYHNDPVKTAESRNAQGWTTLGDVGHVDAEGFLYLTDRKSFMIISGGVNIYPQEIENLLVVHPRVFDAAVIGAPDPEMGEEVVAVIQPVDWADATPEFATELLDFLKPSLSSVKRPRRVDFIRELPRHPTGKLFKRQLRDHYWANQP